MTDIVPEKEADSPPVGPNIIAHIYPSSSLIETLQQSVKMTIGNISFFALTAFLLAGLQPSAVWASAGTERDGFDPGLCSALNSAIEKLPASASKMGWASQLQGQDISYPRWRSVDPHDYIDDLKKLYLSFIYRSADENPDYDPNSSASKKAGALIETRISTHVLRTDIATVTVPGWRTPDLQLTVLREQEDGGTYGITSNLFLHGVVDRRYDGGALIFPSSVDVVLFKNMAYFVSEAGPSIDLILVPVHTGSPQAVFDANNIAQLTGIPCKLRRPRR